MATGERSTTQRSDQNPVLVYSDGTRVPQGTSYTIDGQGNYVVGGQGTGMPVYATPQQQYQDQYDPSRPMGPWNAGHAGSGPIDSGMGHRDATSPTGSFAPQGPQGPQGPSGPGLFSTGPTDAPGFSFNQALATEAAARYAAAVAAAKKKAATANQPTVEELAAGVFNRSYNEGAIEDAIRSSYGGQIGAINDQFGQAMGQLSQRDKEAVAGVQQEGTRLDSALATYAADQRREAAAASKAGNAAYNTAIGGAQASTAAAIHAARVAGVSGSNAAQQGANSIRGAQQAKANEAALNSEFNRLDNEEITQRAASGKAITSANLGDLARVFLKAQGDLNISRADALAKVKAGEAGALAQAKIEYAQKKASFIQSIVKKSMPSASGGTVKWTAADQSRAEAVYGPHTAQYAKSISPLIGFKDPNNPNDTTIPQMAANFMDGLRGTSVPKQLGYINASIDDAKKQLAAHPGEIGYVKYLATLQSIKGEYADNTAAMINFPKHLSPGERALGHQRGYY